MLNVTTYGQKVEQLVKIGNKDTIKTESDVLIILSYKFLKVDN